MKTDVKICGLKTHDCVKAALDNGASHIGFIFFEKSPRNISPREAAPLRHLAKDHAKSVAVTVDANDAFLDEIMREMAPDIIQFHGHESPERVTQIKKRYNVGTIKAFAIREKADLTAITPYQGIADLFLFDAKAPEGVDLPGGNGISFDWNVLRHLDETIAYMLSGGLNANNIGEALIKTHTRAIDISSGVETAPGIKDKRRIDEFFAAVRKAEQDLGD